MEALDPTSFRQFFLENIFGFLDQKELFSKKPKKMPFFEKKMEKDEIFSLLAHLAAINTIISSYVILK